MINDQQGKEPIKLEVYGEDHGWVIKCSCCNGSIKVIDMGGFEMILVFKTKEMAFKYAKEKKMIDPIVMPSIVLSHVGKAIKREPEKGILSPYSAIAVDDGKGEGLSTM